jgi:GTPase involved in cell partitioning and DNA repair
MINCFVIEIKKNKKKNYNQLSTSIGNFTMYFTTPSNLILTQKVDDLDKNKLLHEKIGHINCFIFA